MLGSTPGAEPSIYLISLSLSRIARILSDFQWTCHSRPVSLQRKSARTGTRVHQTLVALCMSLTIHSVALLLNARAASPATDMTAEWPTLEMMSRAGAARTYSHFPLVPPVSPVVAVQCW